MVLSMAVIGVLVAVIYVFIPHDEKADPTKRVDYIRAWKSRQDG